MNKIAIKKKKELAPIKKGAGSKAVSKGKPLFYTCGFCSRISTKRPTVCSPKKAKELYTCDFCGMSSGDSGGVCSPAHVETKYACSLCGKVSPFKLTLCDPAAMAL